MGNEWKEELKFNPQKPKKYTRRLDSEAKSVLAKEREAKSSDKKFLIRGVLGTLAVAAVFVGTMEGMKHGVDLAIDFEMKQAKSKIEMVADENRELYDMNGLLKISELSGEERGSREVLKQECDYYDRMSNSDAINEVTQEDALEKVQNLKELYFEIVKSKIAYTYGLNPAEAKEITYKIWEPIKIGEKEIRIDIPGKESLINNQIPESLQDMIRKTVAISSEKYEDKTVPTIIRDMTYFAGALNKFANGTNYQLGKDGNLIEPEMQNEIG